MSSRANGARSSMASAAGRRVTSSWYRANTAARRWSERRTAQRLAADASGAGDVLTRPRIDAHAVALVHEQGNLHPHPGLKRRRLGAAARRGVALHTRRGLGDGHLDGARHLDAGGPLIDEEDVCL